MFRKAATELSVNLGIMKLSLKGELNDEDRETATRVMDRLADHRALASAFEAEYAGAVVESVVNLRNWVQGEIEKLSPVAVARQPLRMVVRGCRAFISETESLNRDIALRYEGAKATEASGGHLYDDQRALVATVNRVGNPNLLEVRHLKLTELPTQGMIWQFLFALQKLRTTVGFAVRILEALARTRPPRELRRLLPEEIELD